MWFSHFTRYVEALQGVQVRFFFYLKWAIKQFLGGTQLKEISIKDHYKKIENHWIRWYLSTSDQQDLYFIGIKYYTLIEPHTTSTPHRALKKANTNSCVRCWSQDNNFPPRKLLSWDLIRDERDENDPHKPLELKPIVLPHYHDALLPPGAYTRCNLNKSMVFLPMTL